MTAGPDPSAAAGRSAGVGAPPLVSVVMSVHNGLPYLDDAIASVLDQTYPNLEFVFVDDGSTDGSREVLRRFARRDGRIKLVEQANTGLTRALNRGVAEARGVYIARMDADDLSFPGRIARQVRELEGDPTAVAASCFVRYIGPGGEARDTARWRCAPGLIRWYLMFFNCIGGHSQVLFRKSAFDRVGGYDEAFTYSQDYDLWWRLSGDGRIVVIDEVLHQLRVGHGGISTTRYEAQLVHSLEISRRNCVETGGRPFDPSEVLALRRFWYPGYGPPLTTAEKARVAPSLDHLHRAFVGGSGGAAPADGGLRGIIGRRWMFWGETISLARTWLVAGCMAQAVRWSPRLLPTVAWGLSRRSAAVVGRGARRAFHTVLGRSRPGGIMRRGQPP